MSDVTIMNGQGQNAIAALAKGGGTSTSLFGQKAASGGLGFLDFLLTRIGTSVTTDGIMSALPLKGQPTATIQATPATPGMTTDNITPASLMNASLLSAQKPSTPAPVETPSTLIEGNAGSQETGLKAALTNILKNMTADERRGVMAQLENRVTGLDQFLQDSTAENGADALASLILLDVTPQSLAQGATDLNGAILSSHADLQKDIALQGGPDQDMSVLQTQAQSLIVLKTPEKPALTSGTQDLLLKAQAGEDLTADDGMLKMQSINPLTGAADAAGGSSDMMTKPHAAALGNMPGTGTPGTMQTSASAQTPQAVSPGLSTFSGQMEQQAADGSMWTDPWAADALPDTFSLTSASDKVGMSLQGVGASASLVTQTPAAGQAHPATQVVAVQLQRAANEAPKHIEIQMDPPELGKIKMKVEVTKEKGIKAVITAEKPETFMMMQRDAQVLEKALHDAGFDASGNTLNFELASQNGNDFGQDGNSGRGGHEGGGDAANIVETVDAQMDWYVDQNSGLLRLNMTV